MRTVTIRANEHGSLAELRFPGPGRAELWMWEAAWTPRAGECHVYAISRQEAETIASSIIAAAMEGDADDLIPEAIWHKWISGDRRGPHPDPSHVL